MPKELVDKIKEIYDGYFNVRISIEEAQIIEEVLGVKMNWVIKNEVIIISMEKIRRSRVSGKGG